VFGEAQWTVIGETGDYTIWTGCLDLRGMGFCHNVAMWAIRICASPGYDWLAGLQASRYYQTI